MSWTTPRTWSASETETAAIFNLHVRDTQNVIATARETVNGRVRRSLRSVVVPSGWAAGTSANNAGGADTVLTSFTATVPAATWNNYGDVIIAEGLATIPGNNANVKTLKVRVGGATAMTLCTGAFAVSTNIVFKVIMILNSSTNIGVYGCTRYGLSTGTTTNIINNGSFTVASVLTNALSFDFLASSATAADIAVVEYSLYTSLSLTGALV